ncbi:uncharacterized protein LOC131673026 [Phymastichus coffea]|uniref:uncharacterized protein LOC131673026 n=1 Tax=Phymastichus coffea TaxID=108790 RepID=UPI00273A7CBA|nr:uncharacterized protein LOC131673026 [Phymastichus coffea]
MWRHEITLFCSLFLLVVLLPACTFAGNDSKYGQTCSMEFFAIENCGTNERCKVEEQSGGNITKCICVQGYEYKNLSCTKIPTTTEAPPVNTAAPTAASISSSSEGGSSVTAFLLVPTCLIIIGALGYFGARRYKWLQRLRHFRQNRYGNVLVTRDDTDDDDPPIA